MHNSRAVVRCAGFRRAITRYNLSQRCERIDARCYATAKDHVAKFRGTKGSDVDGPVAKNASMMALIYLQGNYAVTLIEGDGIGPEISQSVKDIFAAAKVRLACIIWH